MTGLERLPLSRFLALWALFAASGPVASAAADLVINEIQAANRDTLLDEDGDSSDWIEIHHLGVAPVDVAGWYLTDDPATLTKWIFPSVEIAPGGFLVVFASGKDRAERGAELHTNFRLEERGEFLALVEPDGLTVHHEYAPGFPAQREGISWGLFAQTATLIAVGDEARFLVPADDRLGASWRDPDFVEGPEWESGPTPLGYAEPGEAPAELVGYWPFDGHLMDLARGNHGTLFGAAAPNFVDGFDGRPAGAIALDGVDDYVRVEQASGLPIYDSDEFTVAMWVRGPPQADRRVFSEGSSSNNSPVFNIGTNSGGATGEVDLFIRDEGGATLHRHTLSDGIAFDNSWHHIAWVDRGGEAALYIDGVQDLREFAYARRAIVLNRTSIGAILRAADSFHFQGSIDEVSVWERALSPERIADLAMGARASSLPAGGGVFASDLGPVMQGKSATVYVRMPFFVEDPSGLDTLRLRVRHDAGFVAHLNGREVARGNAPVDPDWSARATGERGDAEAAEFATYPLAGTGAELLRPGRNVLAIHGLNSEATDLDFFLASELIAISGSALEGRYFTTPSPGDINRGGVVDFVADTKFSHDRGYYSEPFVLEITTETPGAEIRYTLDGQAPARDRGFVYEDGILIDRSSTVRVAAFRDGLEPTNVDTQTYLFVADILEQRRPPSYPTSWQGIGADYDMDPELVADPAYAERLDEAFRSVPSLSLVLDAGDMFGPSGLYQNPGGRGEAWERPSSAEWIFPRTASGVQVDAGLRVFGNTSRNLSRTPKLGFRLLFKGKYGARKFEYPLFGEGAVDRFDTLTIRTNYKDSWLSSSSAQQVVAQYIRDEFGRRAHLGTGEVSPRGLFVHLFINGLYWGLYNVCERPDDSFAAEYFGGEKEDYDVIKNHEEVQEGSRDAYSTAVSLVGRDLGSPAAYEAALEYIDVDNMIDYMIANMFAPAIDWPGNYYMVRRRAPGETFKFLSWDSDEALFGGVTVNRTLPHSRDADSPTKFFHPMRANAEFRLRFADHLQRHFFHDGGLTSASAVALWKELSDRIELAMICEALRWGDYRRSTPYRVELEWKSVNEDFRNDYFSRRSGIVLEQFRQGELYPDLPAPAFNRHGGRVERGFLLEISVPRGEGYYTLDGSDPRLPGGEIAPGALPVDAAPRVDLIAPASPARVLVPAAAAELDPSWAGESFDDSDWVEGSTGVGYDRATTYRDLIATDLRERMDGVNASVFLRVPFEVADRAALAGLTLRMKYDDGFVAYLNGVEVARANAPGSLSWNSRASASHSDLEAQSFEDFGLSDFAAILRDGRNVLAIHGLNLTESSSDMLILPGLVALLPPEDGGAGGAVIRKSTIARARALEGGTWSALSEALFVVDEGLRITEIMYHPAGPFGPFAEGDFEFLEIQNLGTETIELDGHALSGAVDFDFSSGTVRRLRPGEITVVAKNVEAFSVRYGVGRFLDSVTGEYEGLLSNGGERLVLRGPLGESILDFRFSDEWLPPSDGEGFSMVIVDPGLPAEAWASEDSWILSRSVHGTPGIDETRDPGSGGWQRPGDANQDGSVDIADAVGLLFSLFRAAGPAPCDGETVAEGEGNLRLHDANGDRSVDSSDVVHLLSYLFLGGDAHVGGTACTRVPGCPDVCGR